MEVYIYDVNDSNGAIVHYAACIPPDRLGGRLPEEAILGAVDVDGTSPVWESFKPNRKFVEHLQKVVAEIVFQSPGLQKSLSGTENNYVYIFDGRTPDPDGFVPLEDILGSVELQEGKPSRYVAMDGYKAITSHGPPQLDSWLEKQILDRICALS